MEEEKTFLTVEQFASVIKIKKDEDGEFVHTFRNSANMLIGADWSKEKLLEKAAEFSKTIELTGEQARGIKHGVVFEDDAGYVFVETDEEKLVALEKNL